ncbi:hypothetical protein [Wenxinia marina]|uniref:Uncharacterized protein n=1 Tax=Wenxinia marina DSM 24838 TaxID=1123501 RepID=A0A0D0QH74_9RHOB|nr:hypothetical protein [Wenxinia marina]KIQ70413.1 hypothetical protein Wenmar_00789 [Wenxinia marina DSM 24838]GGL53351.1 hypothetical protein GCM10011392_04640 [Wenxinia marina]
MQGDHKDPATAIPIRGDGLQLDEHRDVQRLHWRLERGLWVGFGIFVAAALLGFTGAGGWAADRTLTVGAAEVEMPRLARWQAADRMDVRFTTEADAYVVTLEPAFLDAFSIETVTPRPNRETSRGGLLVLEFDAGAGAEISFSIRPRSPGLPRYRLGVGAADAEVWTLVLP